MNFMHLHINIPTQYMKYSKMALLYSKESLNKKKNTKQIIQIMLLKKYFSQKCVQTIHKKHKRT